MRFSGPHIANTSAVGDELGMPFACFWRFRQAPATLNLLQGADVETLDVVRLNDSHHHTELFGEAVHRAL